jgi:hypothetical protein
VPARCGNPGKLMTGDREFFRLFDCLEATPGIEPGYTVLQSVEHRFPSPLTLTRNFRCLQNCPLCLPFFAVVHGKLLPFAAISDISLH